MKSDEELLWIMDYTRSSISYEEEYPDRSISKNEWLERKQRKFYEKIKQNVEFVHSLGFKCDSVGWSSLDLNRHDIDFVLEKINIFAFEEKLYLRGVYSRKFSDFESEWYLLESKYLSNDEWSSTYVIDRDGNPLKIDEVYAYKIPKFTQVLWDYGLPQVYEGFRDCCVNHGFSGVDFYWIRDIGRYNATQFFGLIIENIVPEFACDRYLSYCDSKVKGYRSFDHAVDSPLYQKFLALGGKLPKLSQMFYDLDIRLPIQLPRNKMPKTDFSYVNFRNNDYSAHYTLIKRRAADILLTENVIRKEYLTPVILYDIEPEGYFIQTSESLKFPSEEAIKKLDLDYDKLKKNPKPVRKVSEKDALKLLKNVKSLRPEDFNKGLSKKKLETLFDSPYKLFSLYYLISDGGYLSDEYNFLSYSESIKETQVYTIEIDKEDLLIDRHIGVVVAKCADGDLVLTYNDGSVKRISHETMDVCENWETVAQFFFDVLTDS